MGDTQPNTALSPTQQIAFDSLEGRLASQHIAVLSGSQGQGKTRILRALHAKTGGAYLTTREFVEASAKSNPLALDETIYLVISRALERQRLVIVDDFQFISFVACCTSAYPRQNFLAAALLPLAAMACDEGKQLVFTAEGMPLYGLHERFPTIRIGKFTEDDYAAVCASYLRPGAAQRIDYSKVHRFAPKLNARQLQNTCVTLRDEPALDTDRVVDYLREHHLASNVDITEVQSVELTDLKGMDDTLEALEANVIMPLENADVSEELALQPKRGVLLAGPPGTGKTTIGRALARRLKSKFFLLDGTVISGTPEFFPRVHRIFEAARQNAPAVVFIDDSDVIFENGGDAGLYRFLLTMLDGLESKTAGRICLIMTAMDVGNLPPALVRSGRIELWLETRLPPVEARAAILRDLSSRLSSAFGDIDIHAIAAATEGLAGADLKRVIEDGKLLFAFDREKRGTTQPSTTYFLRAVETVRRNKEQYAEAEARARARRPNRPSFFDAVSTISGFSFDMHEGGSFAMPMNVGIGTVAPEGSGEEG